MRGHLRIAILVIGFVLWVCIAPKAQTRNVQRDNFIWLTYTLNKPLKSDLQFTLSVQSRRYAFPDRQHQLKPVIGLSKKWESGISAGMAFSYFLQALPVKRSDVDIVRPELRPFQYISVQNAIGQSMVSQRLMVEERWIRKTANGELTEGNTFSFRLRYRVMFLHAIDKNKRWKANINNEVMVNAGESVNVNVFDQNRLYFGVKFRMSDHLNTDIGYMYWYQQFASINDFASFHIIFLGLTHTL